MKKIKFAAELAAMAGLAVTVYAVFLSYRMDRGFSSQQSEALAFKQYSYIWAVGALLSLCGYAGLALAVEAKTALRRGATALWVSVALLVLIFVVPIVNKENWTGASFLMLLILIFGYGAVLVIVGLLRLAWIRFHGGKPMTANTN